MTILKSKINLNASSTKDNHAAMLKFVEELEKHSEQGRFQGKDKHIARARKRGKLLARERLGLLLDQDSPFLELLPLAVSILSKVAAQICPTKLRFLIMVGSLSKTSRNVQKRD